MLTPVRCAAGSAQGGVVWGCAHLKALDVWMAKHVARGALSCGGTAHRQVGLGVR